MNVLLWALQIILALKFLSNAFTHGLGQGQTKMAQGIGRMGPYARPLLNLVAVGSLLVAIGLVLPAAVNVPAWVVPSAAAILAVMNLLSIFLHRVCRERPNILPSLVLLALSLFTAYGRWFMEPL